MELHWFVFTGNLVWGYPVEASSDTCQFCWELLFLWHGLLPGFSSSYVLGLCFMAKLASITRGQKKRLERLTSANGCLVVFLQYFINPVTSNNRKEKNPKGLRDLANLVPLCWWLQPFPHHFCCAKGWPLSPLSPSHSQAALIESLEAAGAPVQRLLINASFFANMHASFTFKYCIAPQKRRDAGSGKTEDPCGSVCQGPVCVKFANNSLREDSRAFSLLWGLVWRFVWENWPLSPPRVWCPLRLGDS